MELLIEIVVFIIKIEFAVALWLIEFMMKYWRTVLIALVLGGIFFSAVYFYNYYTLEIPGRNIIYILIAVWLVAVYWSYQGECGKDVRAAIKPLKGWFEEISRRIEKELTPDDHIIK